MPEIIYDFDPRNLPPEYLAAIGLVTTTWSQTDHTVEMLIAALLGIDAEYGLAVTTHMAQPLRDSVARAAAEIRIDDLDALDELDQLLDRVKEAADRRNGIAHQTWCRHPVTGDVYRVWDTSDAAPVGGRRVRRPSPRFTWR